MSAIGNNPLFSVILPTFNRAAIVSRAIQSVIDQINNQWELIIIDDGSTDDTREKVLSFNEPRIRYHYQKNTERSIARNNGIAMAKGNYICFLDSDDAYLPNHLSSLEQFISTHQHPVAMLFTNPVLVHDNQTRELEIIPFQNQDPAAYLLIHSIIPNRVCLHHEICQHFSFDPDIRIGEDTILWLRITGKFPMIHIPKHTVKYFIHDDNTVSLKKNVFLDRMIGLKKLFKEPSMVNRVPASLKREVYSVCHHGIARFHAHHRHFIMMCYHIILSVFIMPSSPQNKSKIFMIWEYLKNKNTHLS